MSNLRILSVGSVVQDVFLRSSAFVPHQDGADSVERFRLGEKYEVQEIIFSTGGGACNAAVTFARQGAHSTFVGKVGDDPIGRMIMDELHAEAIETGHVKIQPGMKSGYSTLLLAPTGERSILVFHGGSTNFHKTDFELEHLNADWMYLSTFTGKFEILEQLLHHAEQQHIKVAFNPGKGELAKPDKLKALLSRLELLSLNKEEMQTLFPGETGPELLRAARSTVPFIVITDGPNGVTATDGEKIYSAGMYDDVPVIDRTGAGDAFSSGFTLRIAEGGSVQEAIIFGSANSTSVVCTIGAKAGILSAHTPLHDMPITVEDF
jgi:sugar/nucleoside kinase (ribokinase family)